MSKIFYSSLMALTIATSIFTACDDDNDKSGENGTAVTFGEFSFKPYLEFGVSLATVGQYMNENYPDWTNMNPDTLSMFETQLGKSWFRRYQDPSETYTVSFYFDDADGQTLSCVSYDGFDGTPVETLQAEVERLGYTMKGELKFSDFNADVCYMYLSADESVEVQTSYWAMDNGSWQVCFQRTDQRDFSFLYPTFNVGDYSFRPYLEFGTSLADVEQYMRENFDSLEVAGDGLIEETDGQVSHWNRCFRSGNLYITFSFADAEGRNLIFVSYSGIGDTPIVEAFDEAVRNGFRMKGELKFPDYHPDVCYMFLSADESLEVQVNQWLSDDHGWEITFQKTDPNDFQYLHPVFNFGSYNFKPYLELGASLADVLQYMHATYGKYLYFKTEVPQASHLNNGKECWKLYGECAAYYLTLGFNDAEGTSLNFVSYKSFDAIQLDMLMAEVTRNGYTLKGKVNFPNFDADVCYMYLSADESVEVFVSRWDERGEWRIYFQMADPDDLLYLE